MVKTVIRWSGLTLAVGALFMGLATVGVAFLAPNQLPTPLVSTLLLVSSILIILALPGMYARQAEAVGWLGLVGYVLLEVGLLAGVVYAAAPLFYPQSQFWPGESTGPFALGTALMVGFPLTAIVTLRAGVYPHWSGILLLAAGAGIVFVFVAVVVWPPIAWQLGIIIFGTLFASGFAWIGISIWTGWTPSAPSLPAAERI